MADDVAVDDFVRDDDAVEVEELVADLLRLVDAVAVPDAEPLEVEVPVREEFALVVAVLLLVPVADDVAEPEALRVAEDVAVDDFVRDEVAVEDDEPVAVLEKDVDAVAVLDAVPLAVLE